MDTTQATYAGFWRRLAAYIIDHTILTFIFVILALFGGLGALLAVAVSIAYLVGFWSSTGQTPGKAVVGVRIVNPDGSAISTGSAFVRYLGYIVSGLILGIGFLMIAFHPRKLGLHDTIAGTQVIVVPSVLYQLQSKDEFDSVLVRADDIQREYHGI